MESVRRSNAAPLLTLLFFTTVLLPSRAQVRGRIIEASAGDSASVPGVVVVWKGTSVATVSDSDGNFSIATNTSSTLLIKAPGYAEKLVEVKDTASFMLIRLKTSATLKEIEIVYQAASTEIAMLNPIKMETLNERSILKAACCNLSESFETNPSIDVNFTDAVSGTRQIQMLGLSGQYAQITKENMPYLRGLASNYGLTFIPGTWIKSIQLSKGAGSVINGYESFTGQINTELQDPLAAEKFVFNSYVNENGRNEYNANFKQALSKKLSTVLLSHMSFNPLAEDRNSDGFADIPTGRQYNVLNKYSYQSASGFEAQFGGGYLTDTRNGGQIDPPPGKNRDSLYRIGINNTKWELYSKTGFVFRKKPGTSVGLQLSYLDHTQDNLFGYRAYNGWQRTFYANLIYQGIIKTTDHTFRTGFSFMNDKVKESFALLRYNRDENTGGAFFEYAYNYLEKFNLVAGMRADYHNYYGIFFTPRLHLRYAFTPNSVLRLSGGHALRTPSIFSDNMHLMASSRDWIIISSDPTKPYSLNAEQGWNYGANYTWKFRINYREAYITVDAYRTDFSSQVITDIDSDPHRVLIYNLRGPSYSNTMQFEFNMEPRKRLQLKTAYRYVDTKMYFRDQLLQKPFVSMHRAFINMAYETRNKHWLFDMTVQYNGSKRIPSLAGNPQEYDRAIVSPDFFNVLGQVTWLTKIYGHDFHLYTGVENLLDIKQPNPLIASDAPYSKYFDAGLVWGPIYGRMLYAGLRFKIK
jgi:outer membrane receptor for ferrienterochelin and colicins